MDINLLIGFSLIFIALALILLVIINLLTIFSGAPFFPTTNKDLDEILKLAKLKKGDIFFELGSGDGRVVIEAAKKYQVRGIGIEINPFWFIYSGVISKINGVKNVSFERKNFFEVSLSEANAIFIFILPDALNKLGKKIKSECKRGTLIISHGFEMKDFKKYQIEKQDRNLFSTYYYKL